MKEIPSDETLSMADIQAVHNAVTKDGIITAQTQLAERESALVAYLLLSAHQIAETVRISGAPASLVNWVKAETTARMLVVIESQQQAHFRLWRDFMGDTAPPEADGGDRPNSSKGDHNG